MQLTGYVWRRHNDRKRFLAAVDFRMEIFLIQPVLINTILDSLRIISLCQFFAHVVLLLLFVLHIKLNTLQTECFNEKSPLHHPRKRRFCKGRHLRGTTFFHIHHRRMHTSFPFNVGSRESLLSCPRILICIPPVTELVLPSGSKATFHPRILRFPSSLRKTLSERAVYVLLFFLAFVHVNHSEGRRICQEMTVDFVPVKLMRKYY